MTVTKVEETPDTCVYTFGSPDSTVGRARIEKSNGDVHLLELEESAAHPHEQFYLAQVVPHLQEYHDGNRYPDGDEWTV